MSRAAIFWPELAERKQASALAAWVRQARAERTKGKRGLMEREREELVRLRKENRILGDERYILN